MKERIELYIELIEKNKFSTEDIQALKDFLHPIFSPTPNLKFELYQYDSISGTGTADASGWYDLNWPDRPKILSEEERVEKAKKLYKRFMPGIQKILGDRLYYLKCEIEASPECACAQTITIRYDKDNNTHEIQHYIKIYTRISL